MTARTAAASMLIVSGVLIVAASAGLTFYLLASPQWLDARLVEAGATADQLDVIRGPMLRQVILVSGAVGVIEGAISIGLGSLVHRGRRWAIGTSIAMTSVRLALVGLCVLIILAAIALGQPVTGGTSNAVMTVAVAAVLLANLILLFIARRRTPPAMPR